MTQRVTDEQLHLILDDVEMDIWILVHDVHDNRKDISAWDVVNDLLDVRADLAALRAKLDKVCEAGDALMRDVGEHATGAFLSADDLYDAIAAAREGEK